MLYKAVTEVIVDDDFFTLARQEFMDKADLADRVLREYIALMRQVLETGLVEGETHDAFSLFIDNVGRYSGDVRKQGLCVNAQAEGLIRELDDRDGDLYRE